MSIKTIKIRSFYYGAGSAKQFNWVKDGYDIFGVGIRIQDIKEHEELKIIVEGETYTVKTKDIQHFVNRYNSVHQVKNSLVKLGVFSISLLKNGEPKKLNELEQKNVDDFMEKWGTKKEEIDNKKLF